MPHTVDLIVSNIAEFNLRNPATRLGPAVEHGFTEHGRRLADQSVFWSAGDRVLVLPEGYDRLWFADVHEALGLAEPPVVCPAYRTGLLVKDLLRDGDALAALRQALAGAGRVRLLSWGATPELYQLAAAVRGWRLEVELDGVAEDDYWASLYLDSKMSCLDLARDLPEVRVPRGITATNETELRGALENMLARHQRVIVRGMHGVGGDGSAVVRAGARALSGLWTAMHRDPLLRGFPLSVQEFLDHAPGVGCPAVDLYVDGSGVAEIVVSAMTVDGHRFRSVNVGSGSVPPAEAERIVRVGRRIGTAAHALGFRGWMCVDYVVSIGGELYVTEINARRSGAMHAISLLARWGRDDLTAHSHDSVPIGLPAPVSYRDLRPAFQRLWESGVRAYPTTVRGLAGAHPVIGLLTAARSAAGAEEVAAGIRAAASRPARREPVAT
jgi:Pre ATP-grasp domain/ATP-grasp domain